MNEIDFMEEYNAIFERSLIFSIIARSLGLASLQGLINMNKCNQRDIFEFGMYMVLDGRAPELIDKILLNITNLETDKEKKELKNIQKDAVLSIQQGVSSEELMWLLNSYVGIELDKATEKFKDINDYILKGLSNEIKKKQANYTEICKNISKEIVNKFYNRK